MDDLDERNYNVRVELRITHSTPFTLRLFYHLCDYCSLQIYLYYGQDEYVQYGDMYPEIVRNEGGSKIIEKS